MLPQFRVEFAKRLVQKQRNRSDSSVRMSVARVRCPPDSDKGSRP